MTEKNNLQNQLERSIELAHLEIPKKEKKSLFFELEKILHFVGIIKKAEQEGEKKFGGKLTPFEQEFPQIKKTITMRADKTKDFENKIGLHHEIPSIQNKLIKVKKI